MQRTDLIVIGGGPAGISAAVEAAKQGAFVSIIDENRNLGGKVLHNDEQGIAKLPAEPVEDKTKKELFAELKQVENQIDIYPESEVWDIDASDLKVTFSSRGRDGSQSINLQGKSIVIATGALERAIPFPGWEQPGVFSIGGLNSLVKRGVLPGKSFLVAGSGPLLLLLANNLLKAGAEVSAVVQTPSNFALFRNSWKLMRSFSFDKLLLGFKYLLKIRSKGIPVYNGYALAEVKTNGDKKEASVLKLDAEGKAINSSKKQIEIDNAAVSYGLMPNIILTRLCGCKHFYDRQRYYWRVDSDQNMQTSVSKIFAAGDGVAIKGYLASMVEGRIAGLQACAAMGHLDQNTADFRCRPLQGKMQKLSAVGLAMDKLSRTGENIFDLISDQTVICRCEEVTMSDIRRAVENGAKDIEDIKRQTRLGMGHCQGRFCGQVVNELLAKVSAENKEPQLFTPRIPAKPISFKDLGS
jgi:thioredoxin reductase/bacterioferritin-associated ferredoxin